MMSSRCEFRAAPSRRRHLGYGTPLGRLYRAHSSLRHRNRFPLERGRVHWPAACACGLLEAVTERQKPLLAEGGAKERDTDGEVVSGKSRGHNQVRKTGEIGDV